MYGISDRECKDNGGGKLACAKTMSGNVDNIISSCHDVNVPLLVNVAGITSVYPLALEAQHVAFPEPLFILP